MDKHAPKVLWFVLGAAIFFILLYCLDIKQSIDKLKGLDIGWFSAACFLMMMTQVLNYWKWVTMYRASAEPADPPLLPILSSIVVCGSITPVRSGDIFASLAWSKIQGRVLAWSVFNRISEGLTTFVFSLFIMLILFSESVSGISWFGIIIFLTLGSFCIAITFHRGFGFRFLGLAKKILARYPQNKIAAKILSYESALESQMEIFYKTMNTFKSHRVGWKLITIIWLNRVLIILVNKAILASLGVFISWTAVLGILAATWFSCFFSPTPSGIGIGDIAPGVILTGMGFQDYAGGYIVLNRLFDVAIILMWSFLWLFSVRARPGEKIV